MYQLFPRIKNNPFKEEKKMKLKSLTGQAITIPMDDGSEYTITPEGTEVSDETGQKLLEKCSDQVEKMEE